VTLAEAISEFGKDTKAKLTNPAATGQREDHASEPVRRHEFTS
jgi:hypothetical protein